MEFKIFPVGTVTIRPINSRDRLSLDLHFFSTLLQYKIQVSV